MTDKPEGERVIGRLWKRRGAPKPEAPAPIVEALVTAEVLTPAHRARIARWVAAQIVSYPPDRCFGCRLPIVYGARWLELVNDNARARFHFDCAPVWRAEQEGLARRAMGLTETSTRRTDREET
jgi:hypothetical protein